jgi:hypothetical protein
MCPPVLKTFTWRLIGRALASRKRVGTYSSNISQVCSDLFFFCNLPKVVWLSADTPINTSSLPHEDDGIQNILSTIITPQTSDDHLIKILNILWYLWNARNDKGFNNKCWIARQVHHTTNADFTIAQSVLQEHDHSSLMNRAMLTVKIRQPSHEFTFGVGMTFVSYSLVLTPVV